MVYSTQRVLTFLVICHLLVEPTSGQPLVSGKSDSLFVARGSPVEPVPNAPLTGNYLNASADSVLSQPSFSSHGEHGSIPINMLAPEEHELDEHTIDIYNVSGKPVVLGPVEPRTPKKTLWGDSKLFGINWKKFHAKDWFTVCFWNPCNNYCTHEAYIWKTWTERTVNAKVDRMSQPLCGPGSIGITFSKTWTFSISVNGYANMVSCRTTYIVRANMCRISVRIFSFPLSDCLLRAIMLGGKSCVRARRREF